MTMSQETEKWREAHHCDLLVWLPGAGRWCLLRSEGMLDILVKRESHPQLCPMWQYDFTFIVVSIHVDVPVLV